MEMYIANAGASGHAAPPLEAANPASAGANPVRSAGGGTVSFAGMLVQVLGGNAADAAVQAVPASVRLSWLIRPDLPLSEERLPAEWRELQEQITRWLNAEDPDIRQLFADYPDLQLLMRELLTMLQQQSFPAVGREGAPLQTDEQDLRTTASEPAVQLAVRTGALMRTLLQAVQTSADLPTIAAALEELRSRLALALQMQDGGAASAAPHRQAADLAAEGADSNAFKAMLEPALQRSGTKQAASRSASASESEAGEAAFSPVTEIRRNQPAASLLNKPVYSLPIMRITAEAGGAEPGTAASNLPVEPVGIAHNLQADAGALLRGIPNDAVMKDVPAAVPAGRFAEIMSETVFKNFRIFTASSVSEARITLIPEHLGQVDIRLTMQNGQLTAQFITDTAAGRDALEAQINQLRITLQSQGVQIEKLTVTHSPFTGFAQQFQEQRHSHPQNHSDGRRRLHRLEEDAAEFETVLDRIGFARWTESSFEVTA
jgi:flagellar hook-length control protein FliK